jgi:hypothetical protein
VADLASPDSLADETPPREGVRAPERRVFKVLFVLACVRLVLAALVNWQWGPKTGREVAVVPPDGSDIPLPGSDSVAERTALDLLPDRLIGYETIARQDVPGSEETVAEAVYATLSMDLEIQRPITVYVRAEVYGNPGTTESRLAEVMAAYPTNPGTLPFGPVVAQTGYTPDEGSFMTAWTTGQSLVMVKSMFRDTIPAQRRDFLERQAKPVAQAVEEYQRTGKQGITR